jgi:hypothetical protein
MSNTNITTFIDHIGRTILAELVEETKDKLTVKNPAILHVQPTPQGQLNVQTIPLYFKEFISEKNRETGTTWSFNKSSIVVAVDVENDSRLLEQYTRLFSAQPAAAAPQSEKVIKLFDE